MKALRKGFILPNEIHEDLFRRNVAIFRPRQFPKISHRNFIFITFRIFFASVDAWCRDFWQFLLRQQLPSSLQVQGSPSDRVSHGFFSVCVAEENWQKISVSSVVFFLELFDFLNLATHHHFCHQYPPLPINTTHCCHPHLLLPHYQTPLMSLTPPASTTANSDGWWQ